MKKLSALGIFILVFSLLSDNVLSIEYNTNISPELTVKVGDCFYMDIRLDDVPDYLITAGFFIIHDSSLATIIGVSVYDGELTPTLWDPGFTFKVPDAAGPDTYMLACGNFDTVSPGDVRIARVEICTITEGVSTFTISTIPNFETVVSSRWVGSDYVGYDLQIVPHTITVHQIIPDCEGDFDCDGDCDGSDAAKFKAEFGRSSCNEQNPCASDFGADGDVDGTDAAIFKEDFGRSLYHDICPSCVVEP